MKTGESLWSSCTTNKHISRSFEFFFHSSIFILYLDCLLASHKLSGRLLAFIYLNKDIFIRFYASSYLLPKLVLAWLCMCLHLIFLSLGQFIFIFLNLEIQWGIPSPLLSYFALLFCYARFLLTVFVVFSLYFLHSLIQIFKYSALTRIYFFLIPLLFSL